MSAVVEVVTAVAMSLAIGSDTGEMMNKQLGIEAIEAEEASSEAVWCEPFRPTRTQYPCDVNAIVCTTVTAGGQLCVTKLQTMLGFGRWLDTEGEQELFKPQWEISDQPTPHRWDGYWWKLRL